MLVWGLSCDNRNHVHVLWYLESFGEETTFRIVDLEVERCEFLLDDVMIHMVVESNISETSPLVCKTIEIFPHFERGCDQQQLFFSTKGQEIPV